MKMTRTAIRFSLTLMTLLVLAVPLCAHAEEAFPLRAKFPGVKPITTDELAATYNAVTIIDVRSKMEYDVVHINKALHIPMSNTDFLSQLAARTKENSNAAIVFYCNGFHCAKSYEAAEQAQKAGFKKILCYDAGVLEWTKRFPEKATLLGRSPAPANKLISKADFDSHKLAFADFKAKAAAGNAVVIDMRDQVQRIKEASLPQSREVLLPGVRNIPGDRLIALLQNGEFKGKTLLIFDAVGKQVQWLQYFLEEHGYRNYFFLKDGVLTAAEAGAVK